MSEPVDLTIEPGDADLGLLGQEPRGCGELRLLGAAECGTADR
jgi:hypothetical protein